MILRLAHRLVLLLSLATAHRLSKRTRTYKRSHSFTLKQRSLLGGLLGGSQGSQDSAGGNSLLGSHDENDRVLSNALGHNGPASGGLLGGLHSLLGSHGLGDVLGGTGDVAAGPNGPLPNQIPGDAPWTQSQETYLRGLTCPGGIHNQRGVVLMIPGTGCRGAEVFEKSPYSQGLPQLGFSICWLDLPRDLLGDMQLSAEFVAYNTEYLAHASQKSISILSYSQGGALAQWALTFWPSLRQLVVSFVGLAGPMRGSAGADLLCTASPLIGGCFPALLQLKVGSNFMAALNAGTEQGSGAFALVPSTMVYSATDEIVVPNAGPNPTSALRGASNIRIQDVCGPLHLVDHFTMPADLGVYGVVLDALVNARPADPSTIDRSYCNRMGDTLGYAAAGLPNDLKYIYRSVIGKLSERVPMILNTLTTLKTTAEPDLQPYVCERGHATQCGSSGFGRGDNSQFILNDLPVSRLVGGLLGGNH